MDEYQNVQERAVLCVPVAEESRVQSLTLPVGDWIRLRAQ